MTQSETPADGQPSGQLLIYEDGGLNIQVRLDGDTVWLTQRLIAELYQVSLPTISEHLTNIYAEGELFPEPTIRNFRIVQLEGGRKVSRTVDHYSLDAVLAVGYRVRSDRGTKFRQWATARRSHALLPARASQIALGWRGLALRLAGDDMTAAK